MEEVNEVCVCEGVQSEECVESVGFGGDAKSDLGSGMVNGVGCVAGELH